MSAVARSAANLVRSLLPPVRYLGPLSVGVLAVAFAVLWIVVGPADGGWLSFAGQLAGAEAVLLMSIAMALISLLPAVETWFDGIDRAGPVAGLHRQYPGKRVADLVLRVRGHIGQNLVEVADGQSVAGSSDDRAVQ